MKQLLAICLAALLAAPALAEPPAHAPAHGYRDKGGKSGKPGKTRHRGYTGVEWGSDFGVGAGRCNTDEVLTALGAAGGAIIGNRTASPENRAVATIIGAIAGGLIGDKIGDAIDDRDRACLGHGLEIAPVGRTVVWANSSTRVVYSMRPVRDLANGCRLFEYRAGEHGKLVTMTACRNADAAWAIRRD